MAADVKRPERRLYLVSDAAGGALTSLALVCLARLPESVRADVSPCVYPLIRTAAGFDRLARDLAVHPGLVLHLMEDEALQNELEARCRDLGVPVQSAFAPLLRCLSDAFAANPAEAVAIAPTMAPPPFRPMKG